MNILVYMKRKKAIIEGLSKYIDWLKAYTNECDYSNREIVEELQSLITLGYIEDYIYIYELPYFGE